MARVSDSVLEWEEEEDKTTQRVVPLLISSVCVCVCRWLSRLPADALEQDGRRFVIRVLRDEPAAEGFREDGLVEAGEAGLRFVDTHKGLTTVALRHRTHAPTPASGYPVAVKRVRCSCCDCVPVYTINGTLSIPYRVREMS